MSLDGRIHDEEDTDLVVTNEATSSSVPDDDDDDDDDDASKSHHRATASNNNNEKGSSKPSAHHKQSSSSSSSSSSLEKTIQHMEDSNICGHPQHYHSFQQVNFSFLGSSTMCAGCQGRMQPVVLFGGGANNAVVKCIACGATAHRSCALSSRTTKKWKQVCPVNAAQMQTTKTTTTTIPASAAAASSVEKTSGSSRSTTTTSGGADDGTPSASSSQQLQQQGNQKQASPVIDHSNISSLKNEHSFDEVEDGDEIIEFMFDEDNDTRSTEKDDSSPAARTTAIPGQPPQQTQTTNNNNNTNSAIESQLAQQQQQHLHHTSHPFATVARALQENVIAHFQQQKKHSYAAVDQTDADITVDTVTTSSNAISQFATGAVQAARTLQKNIPPGAPAVVSAGIVGGVAGMVVAGPAGAYAGAKLGQVAGALGVIAEGSVTIGVLVASVATASITAQQIQEHFQQRTVLTMGEAGTSRKVLLVRPNIQIDPVWDEIVVKARDSAPNIQQQQQQQQQQQSTGLGGLLASFHKKGSSMSDTDRERYRRDSDIVQVGEAEIPTEEKVLLLVSRILSDKSSLPGHMYRQLIQAFRDRCDERIRQAAHHDSSMREVSPRARRDDAHAVIKHVAGALLEVRPEFASSPELTELTAAAVEGLVFGQLYTLVWEEVVAETAIRDAALVEKARMFQKDTSHENAHAALLSDASVSKEALDALSMLPDCHSAVDKLYFCVRFLELISDHLSASINVCADSLLKMVCQHLLIYLLRDSDDNAPKRVHAQVAFLEEFARDEQLLRGREGYALVTLQAACHFLDNSSDFESDIFGADEDVTDMITETELTESTMLVSVYDEKLDPDLMTPDTS